MSKVLFCISRVIRKIAVKFHNTALMKDRFSVVILKISVQFRKISIEVRKLHFKFVKFQIVFEICKMTI